MKCNLANMQKKCKGLIISIGIRFFLEYVWNSNSYLSCQPFYKMNSREFCGLSVSILLPKSFSWKQGEIISKVQYLASSSYLREIAIFWCIVAIPYQGKTIQASFWRQLFHMADFLLMFNIPIFLQESQMEKYRKHICLVTKVSPLLDLFDFISSKIVLCVAKYVL